MKFAQRILDIVEQLDKKPGSEVVRHQLAKAGTSIGANIEEADGTITKRDFVNKMTIARKEAKETRYWLRLISGRYLDKDEVANDIGECQELTCILSSIINKSR
ncbi:MAG: four helix bundle protein [Candidatus Omnitrophica bacterium]|nr:four helix bundle protein [Candidatus Omnitrophota bacterium]